MLVLSRIVWKYRAYCHFFIATEPPTFPPPNAYRIDIHDPNVVKLLRGKLRALPTYTLMCQMSLDAQGYYIKGSNA